jgi:autotransporter-associated beta strand protein
MKPIHRLSIFSIFVTMSLPLAAQSTWTGGTSSSWSNAANWNPGIPAEGSNIIISDSTGNGLTLDDGNHALGSITVGTTGTRTQGFTFQTTTANTLTLASGVTALGNFTGIGPRMRGNYVVSTAQNWQIAGEAGSITNDRGLFVQGVTDGTSGTPAVTGTLTLNANLNKFGTGQLGLVATTLSGAADLNIHDGSLKLNAGAWGVLSASGPGKIAINNTAKLIFSINSGTFDISRPIQFNNTSFVETGTGTNGKTGIYEIASDMEWNGTHNVYNYSGNGASHYNFSGVMSGAGLVTKRGVRSLYLRGTDSNTFSGLFTVSEGELNLDKTGATAIAGDLLITAGSVRKLQANQIANTSNVTITGGSFNYNAATSDTIASLEISSGTTSNVSGFTVTGATTITAGTHEVESGETFTTNSLSIANAGLRCFGNTNPSTINVGSGGLTLNNGNVIFGKDGGAHNIQVNLGGDVVSTGTSEFRPPNYTGPRILDLQGASRSFAVNDGTLDIRTTVQNGSLVKSGAGTLILSGPGSTADFSFTDGPVQIATQANAGNVTHSAGPILMDIGGATPAKLTTSGNFTHTGGTIEISANNGVVTAGTKELVRYGGTLSGTPTVNIPAALAASRMNPVVDYGDGSNDAITITSTAVPLNLVWHGAASGGLWDNNNTANFNTGTETFYALDTVTFDDTGANPSVVLDQIVIPNGVTFNHGATLPTYTVSGTGGISGLTTLTKTGTGTTILATDNDYSGATQILNGVLQVGDGGAIGSLGSGAVQVDATGTLEISRNDTVVAGNVVTGTGTILQSGTGTLSFTGNSTAFAGDVDITAGTLQIGDGGTTGSIGATAPITIAAGATFAMNRSDTVTFANYLSGDGALRVSSGNVYMSTINDHTGGVIVTDGGTIRLSQDGVLGAEPLDPTADAIVLNYGGLKNNNSFAWVDVNRGITISGEAYFAADFALELSVESPITGTGDIFINYDSGKVIFTDTTSDWDGVLTLGADKPGSYQTTGGRLQINTINNGGAPGPLGIASADPANLVFNGGSLIYNGINASSDRGFTLETAGTIDVFAETLTMSGVATGPGSLTKAGAGTLILSNGTNDFQGEKIIAGGTLVSASTTSLGDLGSPIRFTGSTGILDLATDTSVAPYPLTIGAGNSGTIHSNVATPGPGINHTFGNFDLSNVVLNVAVGANVTGGDPRVTIPNLSLSAGAGGTLGLAPTTANLTIGTATIGSGNHAKTLALRGTALDSHVTGAITDGLNILTLRKENDGIWTVSGDNTFTGNVAVDDGVLVVAHDNALGATNKIIYVFGDFNSGRVPELRFTGGISPTVNEIQTSGAGVDSASGVLRNISGNNTLNVVTQVTLRAGVAGSTYYSDAGTLTINTPLVTANTTNRFLTLAGPGDGVINGVIQNGSTTNLPVTKNGTGTWTLNGAHTYTGTTTVNEGTLSLGQAALHDDSAVIIGENGVLDLDFEGTDQVGSLTINGELKGNGVYDATTDPDFITGDGSIRVGPGDGYAAWTAGFAFTVGVNDGPTDDPDNDGIENLLEYVLGGIPIGAGASDTSILPTRTLTSTDLVLTFERSDLSESDVTLKVQWSTDLAIWNNFATIGEVSALPEVEVTEDSPTADLDTIKVNIPRSLAPGGELFGRLHAEK